MGRVRGGVWSGAAVLATLSATLLSALVVLGLHALTLPAPHRAPIRIRPASGEIAVPVATPSRARTPARPAGVVTRHAASGARAAAAAPTAASTPVPVAVVPTPVPAATPAPTPAVAPSTAPPATASEASTSTPTASASPPHGNGHGKDGAPGHHH